jgi:hypothetical protein
MTDSKKNQSKKLAEVRALKKVIKFLESLRSNQSKWYIEEYQTKMTNLTNQRHTKFYFQSLAQSLAKVVQFIVLETPFREDLDNMSFSDRWELWGKIITEEKALLEQYEKILEPEEED